jgi:hypothetical protein
MLNVGDYVTLKKNLILGKKYGTVTFSKIHAQYCGKLLQVIKISLTGTAYCAYKGNPTEFGTVHEQMLDVAQFKVKDCVMTCNLKIPCKGYSEGMIKYAYCTAEITKVMLGSEGFTYNLTLDNGFYNWPEKTLCKANELDKLKDILENENQLQREDSNICSGEGVKGSRVHGWVGKASIRSRPLRDAKSIRGK